MNTKAIIVSDKVLILVSIRSNLYFLLATPKRPSTALRTASSWRCISFALCVALYLLEAYLSRGH
jgi:hypothetical protein